MDGGGKTSGVVGDGRRGEGYRERVARKAGK